MKKILLILSAVIVTAVSCTKTEPVPSFDEIDNLLLEAYMTPTNAAKPDCEVISEGTITYEERAERYYGPDEELDDETLKEKKEFLEGNPANSVWGEYIIFQYYTKDHDGYDKILSAYMDYSTAKTPDHVCFCCPYTHTLESECATEDKGGYEALTYLANGLFIIPDGQGFGADKNHIQTYLNHKLHAQQYYDALLAALDIYLNKYHKKLKSDWTLRVTGASQGAGDAIALHRFLDTTYDIIDLNPLYDSGKREEAEELCKRYGYPKGSREINVPLRSVHKFKYSYVCCGPYCPEVTMKTFIDWYEMEYPCVIPLVIKSMVACNIALRWIQFIDNFEKPFFSEAWNNNRAELDRIYLQKTMKSNDLNFYLCEKMGHRRNPYSDYPRLQIDAIVSKEMTDTTSLLCNTFLSCLREQDLTSGWKPKTPTKLFYCETDNVVPYANTQRLKKLFDSCHCTCKTVKYKASDKHLAHVDCCKKYIKSSWDW